MALPRKKSCTQCRVAKTRCSLTLPSCMRCQTRGIQCDYKEVFHAHGVLAQRHRASRSTPKPVPLWTVSGVDATNSFVGNVGCQDITEISQNSANIDAVFQNLANNDFMAENLDWSMAQAPPSPVAMVQVEPQLNYGTSDLRLSPRLQQSVEIDPQWFQPQFNITSSDIEEIPRPKSRSPVVPPFIHIRDHGSWERQISKYASPPPTRSMMQQQRRYPQLLVRKNFNDVGVFLAGSYIVRIMSSYPTMLVAKTLPPFIHPLCWIEEGACVCPSDAYQQYLPEPLAICASITHMFQNKTPRSTPFVIKTILSKQQKLYTEFREYSRPLQLAALQAISIYLLLLLSENDHDETQAVMLIVTMGEIATKLQGEGYQCPAEENGQMPSWADWKYMESIRRTMIILFMIEMLFDLDIGFFNERPCNTGEGLCRTPVPCSAELWTASSESDWVIKYKKYLEGRNSGKILTYGQLKNAQGALRNTLDAGLVQDLADWSAGVDDFGAMIMMAALAVSSM